MGTNDATVAEVQTALFGGKLSKGSTAVLTEDALKDTDLVALYFSASW